MAADMFREPGDGRRIKQAWGNRCAYCGKSAKTLQLDHVTPVHTGGLSLTVNLVPACEECNRSKGTRHWRVWMLEQRYDPNLFLARYLSAQRRLLGRS